MPHLLDMHWLWLYGALSLGIVAGWLAYALLAAARSIARPTHLAIGAVAVGLLLIVARVVPARYGAPLEIGVILALAFAIGACVGAGLRDIAEFAPAATRPDTSASAAASGSYLFRDAFAGMGAETAYMRATTGRGSPAPARSRPVPSNASLARAPAPGGYTFPATLPFADATRRRDAAQPGPRRHWSWPA